MCSPNLNPLSSNNLIVRGVAAGVTMGGSELARAGYQAMKPPKMPDLPSLPGIEPGTQSARAPDIKPPKRKNDDASPAGRTVLTGALGIDPSRLSLARTTLGGALNG
jgi:hypothetical protein